MNLQSQFEKFVDPIGRVSEKPVDYAMGLTDNPLLFTGEAVLLAALLKELSVKDIYYAEKITNDVELQPGLYTRHPAQFKAIYKIEPNAVSHDEYNGLMFIVAAQPFRFRHIASGVVFYGKQHHWQYQDLCEGADFFRYFLKRPIKALTELREYFKDLKSSENTNLVDLRHPPNVTAFTRLRQPRDVAFYKLAAGQSPGFFSSLWLAISIIVTCSGDIYRHNGGTVFMAWMRYLALCRLESLKVCKVPFVVKLAHKYFNRKLKNICGPKPGEVLARLYFHLSHKDGSAHPIPEMVKRLYDNKFIK